MSNGRAEMKPFWSATPSQAERTHEWDVSGTNWDLYPKGQCLRSPAFPCGGLDGWTMKFYPDGVGSVSEGVLLIKSAREPQVMVKLQYRVESKESPNVSSNCYVDMNRRDRNFYGFIPHVNGVVGVDKISVTVTCVKRKYQPEDVQQVPCIKGDVLRVVSDSTTAEESFFVVGCQAQFEFTHNCYLGQSGEVVAVERFSIQLKHHDGTLLLWGHGALMKSQVGCTTVRLFRDNKSIKTIMVPRPSYQTRLNQEHKLAQSKRRIIQ